MKKFKTTGQSFAKPILFLAAICFFLCPMHGAKADDVLPKTVQSQVKTPLVPMGSGTYRKFGFSVYRITLWTADGTWDKDKPYAIELCYTRDVSKDTLVDAVTDDLREENVASDEVLENWRQILIDTLPDVKEGDTIIGLCLPKKDKSPLFLNEKVILSTSDKTFMTAFLDIWLGPTADESLRDKLLQKK